MHPLQNVHVVVFNLSPKTTFPLTLLTITSKTVYEPFQSKKTNAPNPKKKQPDSCNHKNMSDRCAWRRQSTTYTSIYRPAGVVWTVQTGEPRLSAKIKHSYAHIIMITSLGGMCVGGGDGMTENTSPSLFQRALCTIQEGRGQIFFVALLEVPQFDRWIFFFPPPPPPPPFLSLTSYSNISSCSRVLFLHVSWLGFRCFLGKPADQWWRVAKSYRIQASVYLCVCSAVFWIPL